MHRTILLIIASVIFGSSSQLLEATSIAPVEAKCSLDIPDDWIVKSNTPSGVVAESADKEKTVVFGADPAGTPALSDNALALATETAMTAHGWRIESRDHTQIQSVSFYMFLGTRSSASGTSHCQALAALANYLQYTLILINRHNDVANDDQLQAILHSFHFLGTPEIPTERIEAPFWCNSFIYAGVLVII